MRLGRTFPALLCVATALAACSRSESESAPEGAVSIVRFEPSGVVDGTRPIQIFFSRPVASKVMVDRGREDRELLQVTPPIPGTLRWLAPDVLELLPYGPFRQSTRYQVVVRKEAVGEGGTLVGDTKFTMSTRMFEVLSVEPFFETKEALLVRVNVEFSYPVRAADARNAVTFLDAEDAPIAAHLESTESGPVLGFALEPLPISSSKEARKIRVRIDGSLAALGGGEPLGKEVIREIRLGQPEALLVREVRAEQEGERFQVHVRLSGSVDVTRVAEWIAVSPPVEFSLAEMYHGFALSGPFEAGKTYEVTLKKGLTSRNGAALDEDVTRALTTPNLEPALRFSNPGSYLVRSGKKALGIETVNVKHVGVRVSKVFENNLAHVVSWIQPGAESEDLGFGGLGTFGRTVLSDAVVDVADKPNALVSTAIAFDDLDVEERRGLYRVEVFDRDRAWIRAEKWMVATDLGITAKIGAHQARVEILSLGNSRPVSDVDISFISRTNEVLGTATTNGGGVASIRGTFQHAEDPLTLIVARRGRDFSYLVLEGTELATHELDSGGEGNGAAYSAYVYSDRGIYRPGDRAELMTLVRDVALRVPPSFPIEVEVRDPSWRVFTRLRGTTGEHQAAFPFALEFPRDAATGRYTVRVLATGEVELGTLTLAVEDFMPDRLKVDVTPKAPIVGSDEPASFQISAAYLFGPKAAGLRLSGQCQLEDVVLEAQGFSGFVFSTRDLDPRDDRARPKSRTRVTDLGETTLDGEGAAELACGVPEGESPTGPQRATLLATVTEEGGRAATGLGSAVLHPRATYFGVRRNAQGEYVEAGQSAAVEAIAVDREGRATAGVKIKARVLEIGWQSILKLVNNRYQYVSERTEKEVAALDLTTERGPTEIPFTPEKPGQYLVVVGPAEGEGPEASLAFWAGGSGDAAWSLRYPDRVAMTLDQAPYRTGATARVLVRAPFPGRLTLTVERDQVLWSESFDLESNTGTFPIPVLESMSPNAYVVAHLIRSPGSREKLAPARAFGVVPLSVDAERHRLKVTVHTDDDIRPNSPLSLKVKVDGMDLRAWMTIAAVDEGILQITDFEAPDPFQFFTQKRRLSLRTHDMYSMLMPEELTPASSLSKGSGGDREVRRRHLNPISVKRVKPVAIWSGLVPVGPDGWGVVKLDVPEFSGSLRVMAVAWDNEKFGAGQKSVTVRDPWVLTPTLPRFLAPLDKLTMPVEVYNGTGRAASATVRVAIEGRVRVEGQASKTIELAAGERRVLEWGLQADEVLGEAKVTVSAEGGGHTTQAVTTLPIRPAATTEMESKSAVVKFGEKSVLTMPSGFVPGTVRARVKIGPTPVAQLGASLDWLLQYPYGCLEQTTSRAFPLLYVRELARREGIELSKDTLVDQHVNGAISRIQGLMLSDGALAFWPGGTWGYAWTTAYAVHFLVEAKRAGFAVDTAALDTFLGHLGRVASGVNLSGYVERPDFKSQAYALYVLSLAGSPEASALAYALDRFVKSQDPATPEGLRVPVDEETRALLAGAAMVAGQRTRAGELLGVDFLPAPTATPRRGFWSPTRQDALALSILMDVAPAHRSVPALMESLVARAKDGRWGSTQENALGLMALGKAYKRLGGGREYWGTFAVGSEVVKKFNSAIVSTVDSVGPEWVGRDLNFSVTGAGTAFVGLTVEGIKAGASPAANEGLELSRRFLDATGRPVDVAQIRQGDLVITELTVKPLVEGRLENVAVVDLLAAGLEVENPRLTNAASGLGWVSGQVQPDHLDVRDDRIIFFVSLPSGRESKLFYASRAVTRGTFALPHAHAEAMYDPTIFARAGAGTLTVVPR